MCEITVCPQEDFSLDALLSAWNMPAFVFEQCEKYKIDKTHLLKIESEEINVLIPEDHLATRIDFKHALSLWKQSTEVVVTCSECSDSSSSLICDSPNRSVQNLQQILMQSVIGKEVLSYFKSNKKLLDHHKNTIVELIVTYFLNKGIRLTCSEIEKLADDIVATFPTEEKDYYFSPRNGKSNPKGKLYDKYKNINKKFRKYGLIAATNIKTAIFQKNSIDENISDTLLEDNLYEEKQWLKYNRDDWNQIITKWATTTRLRRHDVLNIKL